MEAKIRELYNDKHFTDELSQMQTFEEASALFVRNGVNLSADTLAKIATNVPENEMLNEDQLDTVSGGGILTAGACLLGGYILGRLVVAITT